MKQPHSQYYTLDVLCFMRSTVYIVPSLIGNNRHPCSNITICDPCIYIPLVGAVACKSVAGLECADFYEIVSIFSPIIRNECS